VKWATTRVELKRWVVVALGAAVVVLAVVAVVALFASTERRVQLPPGCSEADRLTPGCRPVATERSSANTVAIITIIVTPLGAFGVAFLTTRAARERQDRDIGEARTALDSQLEAEGERQRLSLRDERRRLSRQLSHDRATRDLGELRTVLDEATEALGLLGSTYLEMWWVLAELPEHPTGAQTMEAEAFIPRFEKADVRCTRISERLSLRLGTDSEVVTAFRRSMHSHRFAFLDALKPCQPLSDEAVKRAVDGYQEAVEAHNEFFQASYDVARSSV